MTPAWLTVAWQNLGVKEIPGQQHHPLIVRWWQAIKRGGIKDDETPWCSAFVGAMLEAVDIRSTRFEGAASWASWGQPLEAPTEGCIVVITRPGGAHVGFEVGRDAAGRVLLLGGNQGNAVSVAAFDSRRVLTRRWPLAVPIPAPGVALGTADMSRSEA